jgi:hypothetical protein
MICSLVPAQSRPLSKVHQSSVKSQTHVSSHACVPPKVNFLSLFQASNGEIINICPQGNLVVNVVNTSSSIPSSMYEDCEEFDQLV